MSDKPKRRWYQVSLRAIFIALTLGCVVFGGRVEWYRRWAKYHEERGGKDPTSFHDKQAVLYRQAMWRPWMFVWEPIEIPRYQALHP